MIADVFLLKTKHHNNAVAYTAMVLIEIHEDACDYLRSKVAVPEHLRKRAALLGAALERMCWREAELSFSQREKLTDILGERCPL